MIQEYNTLSSTEIYKLMSQTVIPRPIAWIVTEDHGIINAAPFSYFIPLSSKPPVVIVSIGHKEDGSPKDTLSNIRKNKKATICFVHENNLEEMKKTALALPKEESEVKTFEIETTYIKEEYPPIITSTKSAFFCDLFDELDLGGQTIPLLLQVDSQYFAKGVLQDNLQLQIENIARVGKSFTKLQEI